MKLWEALVLAYLVGCEDHGGRPYAWWEVILHAPGVYFHNLRLVLEWRCQDESARIWQAESEAYLAAHPCQTGPEIHALLHPPAEPRS